jgi:hypothetical protein
MKLLAMLSVALLSGCGFTAQGDFSREIAREKGAQAYDEGLVNAEWFICHAASVGSIRRRYGTDASLAAAYRRICSPTSTEPSQVIQ